MNGDSEISIEDLNLSKDKLNFISCLGYYFPFLSNGAELDKVAYRNNILTKLCYEMTIVKWKYHISLIFVFRLFLCNFNQGHRTRNFYTDLSAVGHSVMRGLVTSGQWFRRKFLCL